MQCPKCGSAYVMKGYCKGNYTRWWDWWLGQQCFLTSEHLHCHCSMCRYNWEAKPLNA